jgi:thiol-disulfide isomerase/thioredoxin
MKLKLGLLFAIFSVLAVIGVFYAKDYISYDVMKSQSAQQDIKNLDIFKSTQTALVDYSDNPLDKNSIVKNTENISANGDVIIVHFWASWCAPCVNEIPEIISFMKSQSSNTVKVYFIAVNLDSEIEDIRKFLKSFPELDNDPFVRIWDKQNELSKYFDIDKLPATVVFQNTKPYRKINGVVDWGKIKFN